MARCTEQSRWDISKIVKLKRIVRLWQKLAGGGKKRLSWDVPPDHLAVVVGESGKRFVIRADYLNHPIFRQLLDEAYEEHGHSEKGPLAIPCDEFFFQDIINSLCKGANTGWLFNCERRKAGINPV